MSETGIALVTGGSRGIGRAIALRLAKDGYDVAVNFASHRKEALEVLDIIRATGQEAEIYEADVSDYEVVQDMVTKAEKSLGGITALINNAGFYQRSGIMDISLQQWRRTIDVNLTGCFNCIRAVIPRMKKRKKGSIVNISSMLGFKGTSHGAHYAAAKAGVVALTKSLALELSSHGIRVNAIAPGAIETEIIARDTPQQRKAREDMTPLGRVGQPEEIASVVSFLLSENASYMTGETLHVNGGLLMV